MSAPTSARIEHFNYENADERPSGVYVAKDGETALNAHDTVPCPPPEDAQRSEFRIRLDPCVWKGHVAEVEGITPVYGESRLAATRKAIEAAAPLIAEHACAGRDVSIVVHDITDADWWSNVER
jgi:hypothetical protein